MVVIYVDVLICLNMFTDYLLLLLTCRFMGVKVKMFRLILGALEGGLFSLYIFVPSSTLLTVLAEFCAVAIIVLTVYGVKNIWRLIKAFICFYLMSFCLSGLLYLLWTVLKLPNLIMKNGVFYFNISPLVLIISTSVCYIIIKAIYYILGKNRPDNDFYSVEIFKNGKSCRVIAKSDSGNTLKESFSGLPVVIVDKDLLRDILSEEEMRFYCAGAVENLPQDIMLKQRVVPFNTINGGGSLIAFKADFIKVNKEKKEAYIGVCTNDGLKGEIQALIGSDLL